MRYHVLHQLHGCFVGGGHGTASRPHQHELTHKFWFSYAMRDEVFACIKDAPSLDAAATSAHKRLGVSEDGARAILDLQARFKAFNVYIDKCDIAHALGVDAEAFEILGVTFFGADDPGAAAVDRNVARFDN